MINNDLVEKILRNHNNGKIINRTYKDDDIEIIVNQNNLEINIKALNIKTEKSCDLFNAKKYADLKEKFQQFGQVEKGKKKGLKIILGLKGNFQIEDNAINNIYGYCRVSTRGQIDNNSLEQQEVEITSRYLNAKCFIEGYTGTTKDRPIFNEVFKILKNGDTLVVTKLDRLCRSTKEGLEIIEDLKNSGVRIHILNMGLIEDNPMGNLIITNLLAFAEFERNMIIERTQAGKVIARTKEGYREGRPIKYTAKQIKHALSMLIVNGGTYSYTGVEEITNISISTLVRANNKNKI